MNTHPQKNQKKHAQAMVEFALALPILLMLVFGLMETGRLIFIYASTVSAAREAVRYGSAMGKNAANVPLYQDCVGIRKAAQTVGFINTFADANILITYDGGLDDNTGNEIPLSPANPACGSFSNVKNGDRIKVSVTTQWVPIVSIVPLEPFTITSTSERTIIAAISISAPKILTNAEKTATAAAAQTAIAAAAQTQTAAPAQTQAAAVAQTQAAAVAQTQAAIAAQTQSAALTQTAVAPPNQISLIVIPSTNPNFTSFKINDRVEFTYILQNLNNSPITNVLLTITGSFIPDQDGDCIGTIAPASSITCTGSKLISQTDIDRGSIDATATANGLYTNFWGTIFSISSNSVRSDYKITQTPKLTVVPTPSASPSQPSSPATTIPADTVITYTYKLKNDGNVTLSPTFTDSKSTTITCSGSLDPGITKDCTGTYKVKVEDVTAGRIINTGNVSYVFGANPQVNIPTSITVLTYKGARFSVGITAIPTSLSAFGNITFVYRITNTGDTSLLQPSLTSNLGGTISCPSKSDTLAPMDWRECTHVYNVSVSSEVTNNVTATRAPAPTVNVSLKVPVFVCTTNTVKFSLDPTTSSGKAVIWTIQNNTGVPLTINKINIKWKDNKLTQVLFPSSTSIWSGSNDTKNFNVPAAAYPLSLPTGDTNIKLIFDNNTSKIAIEITLQDQGCPVIK